MKECVSLLVFADSKAKEACFRFHKYIEVGESFAYQLVGHAMRELFGNKCIIEFSSKVV